MHRTLAAVLVVLAACLASPVHAQLLDSLRNAGAGRGAPGPGTGALGGMGGLSMPSVGSASSNNVAGVLSYCVRNNYVGGDSGASSVESRLASKLGAGATPSDPQFASGEQGTLQTAGQGFSLGGGNGSSGDDSGGDGNGSGLKAQMTRKVCAQVLKHARSLL